MSSCNDKHVIDEHFNDNDEEDETDSCTDDDDDDNSDDVDWEEQDDEIHIVKCVFCSCEFDSPDKVFNHCRSVHSFDIRQVVNTWALDCFGYIKMINYIRVKKTLPDYFHTRDSTIKPPWDSDQFMHPADPEDELLQYDIEDLSLQTPDDLSCSNAMGDNPIGGKNTEGETSVTIATEHDSLVQRLQIAEERAKQSEDNLHRVLLDLEHIREVTRHLVLSQPLQSNSNVPLVDTELEEEDAYFSSYGHFSIHEEMLKDRVRTESYRDLMYNNAEVFMDKIVLDVGCGTGILSMFAVQAGASHVYAVDMADVIYQAMDIARENKLEDKITFIKGKLEDITLPVEKVDIIVSEWMGYFLLFESMLDSVLFARAKYLKHNGVVYPDKCNISVSGISDLDLYNKHVTFWEDVYGFKMSCMKSCVVREASVVLVNKDCVVTDSYIIKELDTCTCRLNDLQIDCNFTLNVNKDGPLTALIGYFDIFFEKNCSSKVTFSTSPHATPTHWKQSVFLLDKPIQCQKGDILHGKLTCRKNRKDPRSLIVTISLNDKTMTYYME